MQQIKVRILSMNENDIKALRVYQKKSTFKGATEDDFWYSATLSSGESATIYFNDAMIDRMHDKIGYIKAFEIYNIIGNRKLVKVEKDGETYNNYKYYISDCQFREIPGEELPL